MKLDFSCPEFYELSDFSFPGLSGKRFVVFDLEGTGIDQMTESITQFGAVKVDTGGVHDDESFAELVHPWKPIPEKIEALTGITNKSVADAWKFPAVHAAFCEFCADAVLVAQCGYEYDFPLLDQECDRHALPRMSNPRLDTKALFALLHPERTETFSTNCLSDYYDIDQKPFKRHDALGDALLIAQFFLGEIREAQRMEIDAFVTRQPIKIKRFSLPPL